MRGPWSRGAATGVGSLPGTDNADAIRMVLGEHPLLPYLPELPARGPGADMIGRTAALLVDLAVEIVPSGWRLTARPGRELRRARDLLEADLDALQTAAGDHVGPLKVQLAGPWTLAAGVEVPAGHRVLTDPGAVRDLPTHSPKASGTTSTSSSNGYRMQRSWHSSTSRRCPRC